MPPFLTRSKSRFSCLSQQTNSVQLIHPIQNGLGRTKELCLVWTVRFYYECWTNHQEAMAFGSSTSFSRRPIPVGHTQSQSFLLQSVHQSISEAITRARTTNQKGHVANPACCVLAAAISMSHAPIWHDSPHQISHLDFQVEGEGRGRRLPLPSPSTWYYHYTLFQTKHGLPQFWTKFISTAFSLEKERD